MIYIISPPRITDSLRPEPGHLRTLLPSEGLRGDRGGTGHGMSPGESTPLLAMLTLPTLPALEGRLVARSVV